MFERHFGMTARISTSILCLSLVVGCQSDLNGQLAFPLDDGYTFERDGQVGLLLRAKGGDVCGPVSTPVSGCSALRARLDELDWPTERVTANLGASTWLWAEGIASGVSSEVRARVYTCSDPIPTEIGRSPLSERVAIHRNGATSQVVLDDPALAFDLEVEHCP